jgi:uncharacterized protein (TIGR03067 family)
MTLTAFAPAPFPRSRPRSDRAALSLKELQGLWQVVRRESVTSDENLPVQETRATSSVLIHGSKWASFDIEGLEMSRYTIAVHASARPARIEWSLAGKCGEVKQPWVGLLRREGGYVQVLCARPGEQALDFEAMPSGSVLITLRKVSDGR